MCLYPFAGMNVFSTKSMCFAIWARVDTKFLNLSHHVLSMDDWPGDATFCVWGQPLKITRKNSAKKRSSPLDFILDTCASTSSSHCFNVGEAEHIYLYPFAGTNVSSAKTNTNLPHHVLWVKVYGGASSKTEDWPGDAAFFL